MIPFEINRPFEYLTDITKNLARAHMNEVTKRIKDSIIGSEITSLEMEILPDRKTMYELVIKTTAKPVEIPKLVGLYQPKGIIDCSEIRVRVKMRK